MDNEWTSPARDARNGRSRARGGARWMAGSALLVALLPAAAAHGAGTTVTAFFDGSEPEMPDRLERDATATTCEEADFPGVRAGPARYRTFPFCNADAERCVTATFDEGTCDDDVHLMAYIGAFDPFDLAQNFAGDVGLSDTQPFSFVVPAGATVLIVAQTNFGTVMCRFGFTVDAMPCAAPAPALSASAGAVALGGLALIAAAALRRRRLSLTALIAAAALGAFGTPAAAPLAAADPTPPPALACELACSAAHKACARATCDSGNADRDAGCLDTCREEYLACRAHCR